MPKDRNEVLTVKKIREREYHECAGRGNIEYVSWFLEAAAPFEPLSKIYTMAHPEYKFWKSLVDKDNGHIRIVDGTLDDSERERQDRERKLALVKFRNDIFLFYIIVNVLWMVSTCLWYKLVILRVVQARKGI